MKSETVGKAKATALVTAGELQPEQLKLEELYLVVFTLPSVEGEQQRFALTPAAAQAVGRKFEEVGREAEREQTVAFRTRHDLI